MSDSKPAPNQGPSILVPALITLAVTGLRFLGERMHWSKAFFNNDVGGPGSLVGIVWLAPIFAIWFALKWNQAGGGPSSRVRAIVLAVLALALMVGDFKLVGYLQNVQHVSMGVFLAVANLGAMLAAVVAYQAWNRLGRTLFAYGLAARIPVALLMLVAIYSNWDTHYEKGLPGSEQFDPFVRWILIGALPQLVLWVAFTMVAGMLFGSVAILFQSHRRVATSFSG